jgi:hypothetical protein
MGCRFAATLGLVLLGLALPLLAWASSFVLLMLVLFVFGAGIGVADVTMNVQGVIVQRTLGRSMMSGFHGLFSLGGIVSAASVSALLWLGASPLQACVAVVAVIALVVAVYGPHMLPYGEGGGGTGFSRPSPLLFGLGVLCFIAFMVEGSMLDWSAVFLNTVRGLEPSQSGVGYALFSMTMALGRLNGDRLVERFGGQRVLFVGSLIAMGGIALAVTVDSWLTTVLGFVLVGVGTCNMVPVFCALAGTQSRVPAGQAIATITSIGYLGILLGPAFIGFIAQASHLSVAFAVVGAMLLAVLFSATRLFR